MACKKEDGLAPTLFNIALEYVMRQLLKVQLVDYACDVNIIGRRKRAVSEVYEEPKERAKGIWLNIKVEKNVQNGRKRKICDNIGKDHDIEVVRSFKYVGTEINNTNDETKEIKPRILPTNKA